MRLLVVEHEADSGAVLLGERALALGAELAVVRPGAIPQSAHGFDGVVAMGATPSVNDALCWLADELALLRDADRRRVPVLGVCFGAQALAVALGGRVRLARRPEIGWYTVQTDDPGLIPPGPWFQWHADAITPPPGASVVARSDVCVQAFTIGPHVGVQFHPEVTDAQVGEWAACDPGSPASIGADASLFAAQTRALLPEARPRAHALMDAFLSRVAGGSPRRAGRRREV